MPEYAFQTCDVFTSEPFGGNQLAVFLNAQGLSDAQMQALTKEIGYSETTFVLPPEDANHTAKVRIFNPEYEMPFAGHPNIGTAHLMALGAIAQGVRPDTMLFEEKAGLVEIELAWDGDDLINVMLTAPQPLQHLDTIDTAFAARLAGVKDKALEADWAPCVASAGAPFVYIEVKTPSDLQACQPDLSAHEELAKAFPDVIGVEVFCRVDEADIDIRARMFAPNAGITEDAATGSANVALAGLLAEQDVADEGALIYHIAQGVEMGRPSLLVAEATKEDKTVTQLKIGGLSVPMFNGNIFL